jgi:arylsulfatase
VAKGQKSISRIGEAIVILAPIVFALLAVWWARNANAPNLESAGKIGKTVQDSIPTYPAEVHAPANAPNVVLILTDDVGYGASSTFGGPIPTPNLDRLAARGLKYNNFHVDAICSSTRAALLTGRNHHAVATASVVELTSGFPGYSGLLPKSAATVARAVRDRGYSTAFFGKHHNVPDGQLSAAGPFDLWPSGLGFDYFFGIVGAESDDWSPRLYRGTSPAEDFDPGDRKLLDERFADDALRWLHNQQAADPSKPFFIYFAPNSGHAPHQAPADWIARFRGQFDQGWDKTREQTFQRQLAAGIIPKGSKLTPRPAQLPAWNTLPREQQHLYAHYMEVYAAVIAFQDAQIGRLLGEIDRMGLADNTLVIFIEGDNGASGEAGPTGTLNEVARMVFQPEEPLDWLSQMMNKMGGPETYEHYPAAWAWALNTPFQWMKQIASHLGGIADGLVVSWPARVANPGGIRTQFTHVTDVAPTILEAAGIAPPEMVDGIKQQRIDGTSFLYSLNSPDAPERHTTQYFEMFANRGIYHDGWLANTKPKRMPWEQLPPPGSPLDYRWELYDLRHDFSQSTDLAGQYPDKLKELQALWDAEAWKNNVYPIDDHWTSGRSYVIQDPRKSRKSYVFWGGDISVTHDLAPALFGRSFSISVECDLPSSPTPNGVLVAYGSYFGGWSFYLIDGKPVAFSSRTQQPSDQFRIASNVAVKGNHATVRYDFDYEGGHPGAGGTMHILIDDHEVARGHMERTPVLAINSEETFDTGRDTGVPVSPEYNHEGLFTGTIRKVQVELQPYERGAGPVAPPDQRD